MRGRAKAASVYLPAGANVEACEAEATPIFGFFFRLLVPPAASRPADAEAAACESDETTTGAGAGVKPSFLPSQRTMALLFRTPADSETGKRSIVGGGMPPVALYIAVAGSAAARARAAARADGVSSGMT